MNCFHNILKIFKKTNGEITISLVTIIVTIVIILFISVAAISMIKTEDGTGILDKAQESKLKNAIATEKEKIETAMQSIIGVDYSGIINGTALEEELKNNMKENIEFVTIGTNNYITFNDSKRSYLVTEKGEIIELDNINFEVGKIMAENTPYTDLDGNIAIIPAGFCLVKGSAKVSDGLVISDVAYDDINNSKGGNQFVWIPVDGEILKYEKDTSTWREKSDKYNVYTDWNDEGINPTSVSQYKGFYVSRFEAGIPDGTLFSNNEDNNSYLTTGKNIGSYIPVSKKNARSWNLINQTNAKSASKRMYENSNSVTSGLIDSYAWDTITKWLSNSGKDVNNSKDWGNYIDSEYTYSGLSAKHIYKDSGWKIASLWENITLKKAGDGIEIPTGSSGRNFANNIYDFAGNMMEWTTEEGKHAGTTSTFAVLRGGSFYDEGSINPASYRDGSNREIYSAVDVGFRIVLYIK